MLKRISIVVSVICVAILLLSACGWSPPPPTWVYLPDQTFVLWQTTAGLPQTILGVGEVSGQTQIFLLKGVMVPLPCSPSWQFRLKGSYLPGIPPRNAVVQSDAPGNDFLPGIVADLSGGVHGNNSNRSVLPLTGSIRIQNWCNGQLVANVEARPGPDFQHTWHISDRANGHVKGSLTLRQTIPDGNGRAWAWGDVHFEKNLYKPDGCFVSGQMKPSQVGAPQSESTFVNGNRLSITITNLPMTLNPDPPNEFQTTLTIRDPGNLCDGQTFPVTFKSP